MKIALVHFHLNTGGVTAVIRQQAALLTRAGHEVLLIAGQAPFGEMPAASAVVKGLGYETENGGASAPDELGAAVLDVLHRRWPAAGPDVLHVHNPTLAKNRHLQRVLKQLQQSGVTLLCQIHDFAEDGRPDVYFNEAYVADCHYAVVNGRDRELLKQAGLNENGVHYLPNAITPLTLEGTGGSTDPAPVLYPVRAIRRKNIGEAILLRLFLDMDAPLAITLPPSSARDMPGYRAWQAFVARRQLPVVFEAGIKSGLPSLLAACRYALTTSITEGFGFSFLEPWVAGKALWGRILPDICRDFTACGVRLDHLYTHLWVPLSWMDTERLRRRWRSAFLEAAHKFNRPLDASAIDHGWDAVSSKGRIDFGLLDESFQQAAIQTVLTDAQAPEQLLALNPFLRVPGPPRETRALIAHNQAIVEDQFNPGQYLKRLLRIYTQVVDCPVRHTIEKQVLAGAFLTPDRFSLLKWGPPHG